MGVIRSMVANLGVVGEVFTMLREHKLWWMIPLVTVLMVFAVLLLFATTTGLGPFIYTLF